MYRRRTNGVVVEIPRRLPRYRDAFEIVDEIVFSHFLYKVITRDGDMYIYSSLV